MLVGYDVLYTLLIRRSKARLDNLDTFGQTRGLIKMVLDMWSNKIAIGQVHTVFINTTKEVMPLLHSLL